MRILRYFFFRSGAAKFSKLVLYSAFLIILGFVGIKLYSSNISVQSSPWTLPNLNGPYKVTRVIDGDTIEVSLDGVCTTVRLLGIDTPESVNPDVSKNCEEGIVASNFTKSLLNDTYVYLEYDQELTDNYGRTLAYVYLEDKTFVNELLIKEGYAKPLIIEPNVMHADILIERSTQYED